MTERFETFTALIAGINHSIRKLKTSVMSEFDLKSTHVYCMYYLFKLGTLTAKELTELCSEDKAAISRSIKYLEERGYIVCKTEGAKRYRAPLELTEEGSRIGARIEKKIEAILSIVGSDIEESDRQTLYEQLSIINYKLIDICDKIDEQ